VSLPMINILSFHEILKNEGFLSKQAAWILDPGSLVDLTSNMKLNILLRCAI
jgi:hypothetical protein